MEINATDESGSLLYEHRLGRAEYFALQPDHDLDQAAREFRILVINCLELRPHFGEVSVERRR